MRERRESTRKKPALIASSESGYSSRSSSETSKHSPRTRNRDVDEVLNVLEDKIVEKEQPTKIKVEKTDDEDVPSVEDVLMAVKIEPCDDKENQAGKSNHETETTTASSQESELSKAASRNDQSFETKSPAAKFTPTLGIRKRKVGMSKNQPKISLFLFPIKKDENNDESVIEENVTLDSTDNDLTFANLSSTEAILDNQANLAVKTLDASLDNEKPIEPAKRRVGRPNKRRIIDHDSSSCDSFSTSERPIGPIAKRVKEVVQPEIVSTPEISDKNVSEKADDHIVDEVIEDIWHVDLKYKHNDWYPQYLVKWDGFAPSENTLEPYEHVCHADVLKDYVKRKFEVHEDRIVETINRLSKDGEDIYQKLLSKPKSFLSKKLQRFDLLKFQCNLLAYIYTYKSIGMTTNFMRSLRYNLILSKFYEKEESINSINLETVQRIMAKESVNVTIENAIDFSPVPHFNYLEKVQNPFEVPVEGTGCKCSGGVCSKSSNCCPSEKGLEFIYDVDGCNSASMHQIIIECNNLCKCSSDCLNRRPTPKFSFCLFKTADRGWALKAREAIPAGSFVIEYTGELIDQTEALKRSIEYKMSGNNYMFDLDYSEDNEATYSIDATNSGNLSRFVNHSCSPNLQTWPATSCNENPKMHRLYYFALRPIRSGEELTVDYSGGVHLGVDEKPPEDADACRCGSANCKGYIF